MKKSPYIILAATILLLLSGCNVNSTRNSSALSKFQSVSTVSSSVVSPSSSVSNQSSSDFKSAIFGDVTDYIINSPKTYTDKRFKFSVDYPAEWKIVVDKVVLPTSKSEGSPDSGVNIYVEGNKNECIYVAGQISTITGFENYSQENFITKSLLRGKLYSTEYDKRHQIVMLLDEKYYKAIINVSDACFTRNKAQILGILKSIRLG